MRTLVRTCQGHHPAHPLHSKITRVVGLSSSVLFDKADPQNPINRRISIVVMTQAAEAAALAGAGPQVGLSAPTADPDVQAAQGPAK
ncbi:motB [Stenotrophomonas maltophilia]|nr:motB [Stenotrophomonas maltophilia]